MKEEWEGEAENDGKVEKASVVMRSKHEKGTGMQMIEKENREY